jgi:polyhydroxybutyrate depolymerase
MAYVLLLSGTLGILILLVLGIWIGSFFRRPPESGKQTIEVDGEQRTYYIEWPARLRGDHPLLLCFHGGLGSAEFFQKQTRSFASAVAKGYVVVFPEAPEGWIDARPERGGSRKDLDFIDKLLDHLLLEPEIDPTRIFGVGSSNGGLFLFRLAVEKRQRFAGFASALAQLPVETLEDVPPAPVPILLSYGRRDFIMPFEGGDILKSKNIGVGGNVISAAATLDLWIERNRTFPVPKVSYLGNEPRLVEVRDFAPQPGGAAVRYVEIQNWSHRWPRWDADPEKGIAAFDIADLILDFFQPLSLPQERLEMLEAAPAEA